MLLLNEKETKIIIDAMEFLETLGTPDARKQAEKIDDITYAQTQGDADVIDLLLGCFNELDDLNKDDFIYQLILLRIDDKRKDAEKELSNDTGYHNVKLKRLEKDIETLEKVVEGLEV